MSATDDAAETLSERLLALSRAACDSLKLAPIPDVRIDTALDQAVDVSMLVNNLAEVWRVSPEQVRELFVEFGLGAMLAHDKHFKSAAQGDQQVVDAGAAEEGWREWGGPDVRVRCFNPGLSGARNLDGSADLALDAFLRDVADDPFVPLYRTDALEYHRRFVEQDGPKIEAYVSGQFGADGLKYLINSGIGANEQFNHLVSALSNVRPDRRLDWYVVHSTKELARVPGDARVENTLFMEFSRSGITEETIKLHEFTPREAARVVFANKGPLRQLAERDGNLVLGLPDEVSGRFGRNKTPILLAPMWVAGLDTQGYWADIDRVCRDESLANENSLPVRLASYIRVQQLRRNINHIYLGANHPLLVHSADEFCQFWNEGPNKHGNDILMSRYVGLPRDSHMNLEGILANHDTKMAIFLICTGSSVYVGSVEDPRRRADPTYAYGGYGPHPLLCEPIDPINPDHARLSVDEHDLILTLANLQRCSELMPTVAIAVPRVDLTASALLGQLWADVTFVYSRLVNVDPGSNPEVKAVRTRAASWLADKSAAMKLLE